MANNKKLKWYHYTAKVIVIILTLPVFPVIVLVGLASGDHPLALYRDLWES